LEAILRGLEGKVEGLKGELIVEEGKEGGALFESGEERLNRHTVGLPILSLLGDK
jgi:hypothetical protein